MSDTTDQVVVNADAPKIEDDDEDQENDEQVNEENLLEAGRQEDAEKEELESVKIHNSVSSWPAAVEENAEFVAHKIVWPPLHDSSQSNWKWLLSNKKLLIRCVTWNQCGKPAPSIEKIRKTLITSDKYHIIAVGTQECERSIAQSAVNPSKKQWEATLTSVVGGQYSAMRSHTLQVRYSLFFCFFFVIILRLYI